MKYDKMIDCFNNLRDNVNYALDNSNLEKIFATLDSISGPTLVTGVGGSSVVANFLAKILREKNHQLTSFVYPRDIAYMNLSGYQNIICVSYSGNNLGVDCLLDNNLNKYLFTGHKRDDFTCLTYQMKPEISYVSVSNTIAPLAILLSYYKNDRDLINEILALEITTASKNQNYEIMSGYETSTAATLLESSIIESGMASCVIHEKYNYCHGRINMTRNIKSDLIYFENQNELDDLYQKVLPKYYQKVITIKHLYQDEIINDFYASVISLKLCQKIANNFNWDFSDMKELVDNDLLYRYQGKLK